MGRTIRPEEITGPFGPNILNNAFSFGDHYDQGTLSSSGTITTQYTPLNPTQSGAYGRVFVTTSGAVTGVLLQAGLYNGQLLAVLNYSGNSITFASVTTSLVLSGTAVTIAANRGQAFLWTTLSTVNSGTPVWMMV